MVEVHKCHTVVVGDVPSPSDELGGAHDRLANALADMVTEGEGGYAIGLEGQWGAGKSTVIELLSRKLPKTVFVFDAWAHQGDPLRRSFIEKLYEFFSTNKKGNVGTQEWLDRMEELRKRLKRQTIRETPQFATIALVVVTLIILAPLGSNLLVLGLKEDVIPPWVGIVGFGIVGLVVAVPLVLLILTGFSRLFPRRLPKKKVDRLQAVFIKPSSSEIRSESNETPDPTSVEFEETFSDLMEDGLPKKDDRLVIVLDNLDRVAINDARSIWSTMRTFMGLGSHRERAWFARMWVVVPYDAEGVAKLWNTVASTDGSEASATAAASNSSSTSNVFLDKSFQVRFKVPPPVLSDWKRHLEDLLNRAFPDHEKRMPGSMHSVYMVLALHYEDLERMPTPRKLKTFVNDLGGLHRQWCDQIPLPVMAHYVLSRDRIQSPASHILAPGFPDQRVINISGSTNDEIRDLFAMLYFNVDRNRAREILLTGPIDEALAETQGEKLRALSQSYPSGFWPELERSCRRWLGRRTVPPGQPGDAAFNFATSFVHAGLHQTKGVPEVDLIVRNLRASASDLTSWRLTGKSRAESAACLMELIPDDIFCQNLLSAAMPGRDDVASEEADSGTRAVSWVEDSLLLLRRMKDLSRESAYSPGVPIHGKAADALKGFGTLKHADPDKRFWLVFRAASTPADINEYITITIPKAGLALLEHDALSVLLETEAALDWGSVIVAVQKRLSTVTTRIKLDEVARTVKLLWQLRATDQSAAGALAALSSGGPILHWAHDAYAAKDIEALCWCLLAYLDAVPKPAPPPPLENAPQGYENLTTLFRKPDSIEGFAGAWSSLLLETDMLALLWEVLEQAPQSRALVGQCVKHLAGLSLSPELFGPEVLAQRWQFFVEALGAAETPESPLCQLLGRLRSETPLVNEIRAADFRAGDAGLYAALLGSGANADRPFVQWCVRGLVAVDSGTWSSAIAEDLPVLRLLFALRSSGEETRLGPPLQDALVRHAEAVISSEEARERPAEEWELLRSALDPGARKALGISVYRHVCRSSKIDQRFFRIWGDEIATRAVLMDNHGDTLNLFERLLTSRDAAGFRWMLGFLEREKSFLSDYPDPGLVKNFKERLTQALVVSPGDDASDLVVQLADALGVERPDEPPSEQGGEP